MSDIVLDRPAAAAIADRSWRKRKVGLVAAGVIGLLAVIGVVAFNGGSAATRAESSSSEGVAAAAAEAAWSGRTAAEQARVCSVYKVDSAVALSAIDGGIGGNAPALLAAFDNLLSKEC